MIAERSIRLTSEADAAASIGVMVRDANPNFSVVARVSERAKLFAAERFKVEIRQSVLGCA
jgi:hypothetical protein